MLIYVAHPFDGKKENAEKVAASITQLKLKGDRIPPQIRRQLPRLSPKEEYTYISPIHTFGYMYNEIPYTCGIDDCLSLLGKCDALLILGPDWFMSKGVMAEYGFALAKRIPIAFMPAPEEEIARDSSD